MFYMYNTILDMYVLLIIFQIFDFILLYFVSVFIPGIGGSRIMYRHKGEEPRSQSCPPEKEWQRLWLDLWTFVSGRWFGSTSIYDVHVIHMY